VAQEKLFNPLRRKLLRKRIPLIESIIAAAVVIMLAVVAIAVLAQRDRYDPAERDFTASEPTDLQLFHTPMKRWAEPGAPGAEPREIDLEIFPKEILGDGWELDGRVESYDPTTLYEKINGAAELYLSYGFRKLYYLTIAKGAHSITVELYDQALFRNALGIFAGQKRPEHEVERFGAIHYYATPVGAIGRHGEYYFKIAGNSGERPVLAKTARMVEDFAGLPVAATSVPAPYDILTTKLAISPEEIEYRRDNVFQYDFVEEFWFAPVGGGSQARYFVHQANDAATADALYKRLVEEQKWEFSVDDESDRHILLRHEYLGTFFGLGRSGPFIFGVDAAPDREVALRSLGRLKGTVGDER
jgi:hypothetical protein